MDQLSNNFRYSDSDINGRDSDSSKKNHRLVEQQAYELMAKLGRAPDNGVFPFYCKAIYSLTEAQIAIFLETAQSGRDPAKYFSYLVSKKLGLGQFKND